MAILVDADPIASGITAVPTIFEILNGDSAHRIDFNSSAEQIIVLALA